MPDPTFCQRCGCDDALDVQRLSVDGEPLLLCKFCRSLPGGFARSANGIALATVGNILAQLIKRQQSA